MDLHWISWSAASAAAPRRGTITTTRANTNISLRMHRSYLVGGVRSHATSPLVTSIYRTLARLLPTCNPQESRDRGHPEALCTEVRGTVILGSSPHPSNAMQRQRYAVWGMCCASDHC